MSQAAGDSWSTEEADNDSEDSDEEEDDKGAGEDCGAAARNHRERCEIREAGDKEARRRNFVGAASLRLLSRIVTEIQDPPQVPDDKCCCTDFAAALGNFSNHSPDVVWLWTWAHFEI